MKKNFKVSAIATIGSALECYDFVIYAALIPYLNYNFFSHVSPTMRPLYTLMVFAVGYISRPVGGIILGTIGDKYGRKKTFVYSLSLMAISTLMISLLPSAKQVGSLSILLLVIFRYIQGFSQGGEVPGAITFVTEHVGLKQTSKYCSFIFLGIGMGSLLSSLVCYILTTLLSEKSMIEWGWRLPFILGGLLGIISIFIRKQLQETPYYIQQAELGIESRPIIYLIKNHRRELLKGFSLAILAASLVAFTLTYPAYANSFTGMDASSIYLIMSTGMLTMAILVPVFGNLSDRYGANNIFIAANITCIIASPFLFNLVSEKSLILNALLILMIQSFAAALLGSFPTLLANLFPSKARYTGIAVSYNSAFALSAFIPAVINYLTSYTNQHLFVGLLFSFIGLVGLKVWKNIKTEVNFLSIEKIERILKI